MIDVRWATAIAHKGSTHMSIWSVVVLGNTDETDRSRFHLPPAAWGMAVLGIGRSHNPNSGSGNRVGSDSIRDIHSASSRRQPIISSHHSQLRSSPAQAVI